CPAGARLASRRARGLRLPVRALLASRRRRRCFFLAVGTWAHPAAGQTVALHRVHRSAAAPACLNLTFLATTHQRSTPTLDSYPRREGAKPALFPPSTLPPSVPQCLRVASAPFRTAVDHFPKQGRAPRWQKS